MPKKTVVLRAPLLSLSGYGVHSRQIFKWLMKKDVNLITQIVSWGMTSWMIDEKAESGIIGEIMRRSDGNLKAQPDLSVQIQLPNEWDPKLAKKNIGVSAFVETDICNPVWLKASNAIDHIVVPSQHVKETIVRSGGITSKLSVIPESFMDEITTPTKVKGLNLSTTFNFLVVSQLTGNNQHDDRKNIYNTVKWFCETFKDDPDVGLIVKTNSGAGTTIDKVNTRKTLKLITDAVKKSPFPKIYMLHGNMTQEEMSALYYTDSVKALINLTRGEGFGLPILEAAAANLPVITTDWSGHLDFMKLGRFIPISYQLSPVHKSRIDGSIFVEGSKWAEPEEADFKKKIRKFRESNEIPRKWAEELGAKLRVSHTQTAIEKIYDAELGYLL